ncbi:hypothetical protein K2F40_05495 [Clostridium sp. CM028]|uniref:hypothetical protein n=1 Tax=unclassified Clostridium TaxID=2614128 RepID=UPI001C0D0175|nr:MULTISPECIES: hypothetical protein [unclassified Clostridium]MBU3091458.1 hypothetical protein [Clostridium sp. CF011]MBW9145186.1 hypothetical protein [Clostridium sp. CM027]MBW9148428.1 hypothetical protein [Clostridium sp. CM028]UVE40319.1 hypothetical protein KTC92_14485 [Clostridium sp. CM027]WAG69267.1 hypothetical protein LL036_14870 [Clostridium sp. CF011]
MDKSKIVKYFWFCLEQVFYGYLIWLHMSFVLILASSYVTKNYLMGMVVIFFLYTPFHVFIHKNPYGVKKTHFNKNINLIQVLMQMLIFSLLMLNFGDAISFLKNWCK